jgi:hypothetical protein
VSETRVIERHEDMSPLGRLRLIIQQDGDILVCLVPDPDDYRRSDVEFCTVGSGGGKSPHTLRALRALAEAMEQDNREHPFHCCARGH